MAQIEKKMNLTICIPTFKRATYLKRCLESIFNQLNEGPIVTEIVIFDNCSPDDTTSVVADFQKEYHQLKYFKNEINIGPDANIAKCYLYAKTNYVWVLGDDDVLLPGCLAHISKLLINRDDVGILFLSSYSFLTDFIAEKPKFPNPQNTYQYAGGEIISKVVSNVSFISGNIITTKFISETDIQNATGTCLNQMPGIINAILKSPHNIFVNKYFLAQQSENSSGFKYFNVFGHNFPQLASQYISNEKYKRWIFNQLIINIFPLPLLRSKLSKGDFIENDAFDIIKPNFKKYWAFWILLYPIHKLPYSLAAFYAFFVRALAKFVVYLRMIPNTSPMKLN